MYLHPRNAEQSLPTLHAAYDARKCEEAVELRNVTHTIWCDQAYTSYCPDYGMDLYRSAANWIASFWDE